MNSPINIWFLNLETLPEEIPSEWMFLLSDAERQRANTFTHAMRRKSYIASHAMIYRQLTAQYVDIKNYTLSHEGKPRLLEKSPNSERVKSHPVSISISHSDSKILCATTLNKARLGCDIEARKSRTNSLNIAQSFFTRDEYLELKSLHEMEKFSEQEALFYRMWTSKEAWLKAQGLGIANGLKLIQIKNGCSFHIANEIAEQKEAFDWTVWILERPDYSLAITIDKITDEKPVLQYVDWSEKDKNFYVTDDVFLQKLHRHTV
jgi:4'-phosphopantetheinyl transferase